MFLLCSLPVDIGRVAGSTALRMVAAHPSSADKDPMNDDREIQDTDTDRRAIQLLLGSFSSSASVDPMTSPVEDVDAVWRRMAVHLANVREADFDEVLDAVRQVRRRAERAGSTALSDDAAPSIDRAEELLTLIIDWRHGTWEGAEIAAGRDPHRPA